MHIFPVMDLKGGLCVHQRQGRFDEIATYAEDPVKVARRWKLEGAQWLHILDLDGARLNRPEACNLEAVRRIIQQVNLPIQFGGGVRNSILVERMLQMGIERVVVSIAVARDAQLAEGLFTVYGDRVAVAIDSREGIVALPGWMEYIGETATAFAARMAALGAKRFIFTDIGRAGRLQGVNVPALAQIAATVPHLPVLASGGVTTLADIDAILNVRRASVPNIEGILLGKALYAGTVALSDVLDRVRINEP